MTLLMFGIRGRTVFTMPISLPLARQLERDVVSYSQALNTERRYNMQWQLAAIGATLVWRNLVAENSQLFIALCPCVSRAAAQAATATATRPPK